MDGVENRGGLWSSFYLEFQKKTFTLSEAQKEWPQKNEKNGSGDGGWSACLSFQISPITTSAPNCCPQYSWCFFSHFTSCENLNHTTGMFPTNIKQMDTLPSCFCYHTVNQCHFHQLLSIIYSGAFRLLISLFKIATQAPCSWHVCLLFVNKPGLWCAFGRKEACRISFVKAWVTLFLAVNSMLISNTY